MVESSVSKVFREVGDWVFRYIDCCLFVYFYVENVLSMCMIV